MVVSRGKGIGVLIYLRSGLAYLFLLWALSMVPLNAVLAQQGAVSSSLSATEITRDESVTLTIVAVGLDAELDTSALNADFDVIGRSSSREVSTITGANNRLQTTSTVTWALELIPRRIGILTVPAVRVGGIPSQIHTLMVNEIPSGAGRDVFVEASVDTETPFVQSQVILTLRVFQAIDIVDGGLDVPSGEHLIVERLGDDARSVAERDGRQYSVTERRFALFPQKSGAVVVDPIALTVTVPAEPNRARGFFSPTRKITRRTDSIVLQVRARPDNSGGWWLPAKGVQLASQWVGGNSVLEVDRPMTRQIVMRVSGVLESQLPEINIPAIDGASLYAEKPVMAVGVGNNGLIAEQTIKWAVIPQRVGELVLPEITLDWFNTATGRMETARIPEERLQVAAPSGAATSSSQLASAGTENPDVTTSLGDRETPGASASGAAVGEGSASMFAAANTGTDRSDRVGVDVNAQVLESDRLVAMQNSVTLWRNLALLVVLLWGFTLAYLLWYRRRPERAAGDDDESPRAERPGALRRKGSQILTTLQPLAEVVASCESGDLLKVRESLLAWASRQWPLDPPRTLDALAQRLGEGEACDCVQALNALIYGRQPATEKVAASKSVLEALPDRLKRAVVENQAFESKGAAGKTPFPGHRLPSL